MESQIKEKFAYLPKVVSTWRRTPTKALIWLQKYYIKGNEIYCLKIGTFSHEF